MRRSRKSPVALLLLSSAMLVACTSTTGVDNPTATGSQHLGPTGSGSISVAPTTAPTVAPETVAGMLTGPGVDDSSISLGLLVDPAADRGFTAGVNLWRDTVNNTGGLCHRTIQVALPTGDSGSSAGSPPPSLDESYDQLGRNTLGLITLEPGAAGLSLASRIRSDGVQALTPEGVSAELAGPSPVVLGATDDILAINAAGYLLGQGVLKAGSTLGVLIDNSAGAADVLAGLTWWAHANNVTLHALQSDDAVPQDIPAVFAATGPSQVAGLLSATTPGSAKSSAAGGTPIAPGSLTTASPAAASPAAASPAAASPAAASPAAASPAAASPAAGSAGADAGAPTGPIIATTLDGYDPSAIAGDQAGRLLVATVTPVSGADHPAVRAVDAAFAAAGGTDPGPRMLEGYATGEAWARLLEPMCASKALTRSSAAELLKSLAPASPDSLFGPTNPAIQVSTQQPASRVSAISLAEPGQPGGLKSVTLLESAAGIGDYHAR